MGNHRFRLSEMIPNFWFYKLKDLGKARSHNNNSNTTTNTQTGKKKQQPTKSNLTATATATAAQQKANTTQPHHHQSQYSRKSYYFTRELTPTDRFYNSPTKTKSTDTHFPDHRPRKSSKQKRNRKRTSSSPSPKLVTSSVSAACSCSATIWKKAESPPSPSGYSSSSSEPEQVVQENGFRSDQVLFTESFDNMVARFCGCKINSSDNAKHIVVDEAKESLVKNFDNFDGFDCLSSDLELPPIITKPSKFQESQQGHSSLPVKVVVKEERVFNKEHKVGRPAVRKCSVNSPRLRLRMKMNNSPRIANRKILQAHHARRSTTSSTTTSSSSSRRSNLSDSLAIVQSSIDPQRDFRDSMVEMIVENNISESKDLEDLLACYLSLNSDEYHELIIKVFKQIWFDLRLISN